MKTQFLSKKQFPFLIKNKDSVMSEEKLKEVQSRVNSHKAPEAFKKVEIWNIYIVFAFVS